MRYLHKSWQSDRPIKKHSVRLRWYQGESDIRIQVENETGRQNYFFESPAEAQNFWNIQRVTASSN